MEPETENVPDNLERIESLRKIWQLLQNVNRKKTAAAVWIAVMAVVFLAGCGGSQKHTETTTTQKTTTAEDSAILPVSDEEVLLLSELYRVLTAGDLSGAATVLNENKEVFDTMMSQTLNGEKYGYYETVQKDGSVKQNMEKLSSSGEFTGMVLTRYNTVFYGSFLDGMPDGECTAIQTMILDHPRYSYAVGTWEKGKMTGEGRTGYHYYSDAPQGGLICTEKRGFYRDNLLDGMFLYETESVSGETLTWEIRAINGVTVITQDWEHYPYRKEYMLGSKEDAARAYVLSRDKAAAVLWNNLILWN